MARSLASLLLFVTLAISSIRADLNVYTDGAVPSDWQNWSWGTDLNFAATDVAEGSSSISVTSQAWSALSLKAPAVVNTYAGLKFDFPSSENPDISISLSDSTSDAATTGIALSQFTTSAGPTAGWNTVLLNFNATPPNGAPLPTGNWDRINFQAGANGATVSAEIPPYHIKPAEVSFQYHLDNIILVDEIVVAPKFLSAEPLANNLIAVTTQGTVDLTKVTVTLNGKAVKVTGTKTAVPVDSPSKSITYLTLASSLAPGPLVVTAGDLTSKFTLPAYLSGTIVQSPKPISNAIYGVNFPASASYIQHLGVTRSRWGGNAVTAYNPFGEFTNAGNDWYFENRVPDTGSADSWLTWVSGAGSDTFLTIPALDWVSKDASSYSFPKTKYPTQAAFDPFNADAGNGQLPNGSWVAPPDPTTVYTAWNTTAAKKWLTGLSHKPTLVAIDNEIEIAGSTHYDMHPQPMSYDEELARVVNYSIAAKEALPNVQVAAPSTCSWWFYWTSAVGFTDNAAHDNVDFIPWFLDQMKAQETKLGKRLLDVLDLHYYYQADTSANDAAAKALRLRMTRSLWDPTYVDESWVGTSAPQNHQPNATIVQLIPRIQGLIKQHYPGTKFMLSEWSSTNDADITGGLVTAESLGIFGKYGLDAATYWGDSGETTPVGLAYWLYRGYGTFFGTQSLPVTVAKGNPDTLGVFASQGTGKGVSVVIINKDPSNPVALNLSGVPTGTYFIRHFGGAAGVAKWQTTISLNSASYLVVPSYTALFLQKSA